MTKYIDKLLQAQKANNQEVLVNDGSAVRSIDCLEFKEMFGLEYIRRSVFGLNLQHLIDREKKAFLDIIKEDADYFSKFLHKQMKARINENLKKEKKFWEFLPPTERRFLYGNEIANGNTALIIICSVSDVFQNKCLGILFLS